MRVLKKYLPDHSAREAVVEEFLNTYKSSFFSDEQEYKILVHDEVTGETFAQDAFDYGIHNVRGVTAIPNTDYIAISDMHVGIAVVHARTLQMVANFKVHNFKTQHIIAT